MAENLIVCIGNALAGDDGAGHAVHASLRNSRLPEGTRLKFLGLGGIDLLEHLQGEYCLVVVDAVQLGQPAGTVHVFNWDELPGMQLRPVSGHGIGIREAIEVGRKLWPDKVPQKIWLVGVEGQCFDQLGEKLTPEVAAAIPRAVSAVLQLLA